ncbi:MAG: hypothetical protein EOM62_07695 [Bacteroidia bacterium]|nr:hypothetical protein [Bacteroidia bacterium]
MIDMRKKLGIKMLSVIMVLLLSGGMIGSAYAASYSIQASDYLDSYGAWSDNGTGSQIEICYDVNGTNYMDIIGVSYLVVQEYNSGSWTTVASTFGTTANGLLAADTFSHTGSIIYPGGTSGKQYRARVTVYAELDGGSDSRTVTTNTVTAG